MGLRVKAPLALQFRTRGLTSFAGLELVRRYFLHLRLAERLRQHLSGLGLDTDFGTVRMVLLLLGLLIAGGRRLRHLMFLKADPMVLRFCGLQRVPTPRTVAAGSGGSPARIWSACCGSMTSWSPRPSAAPECAG